MVLNVARVVSVDGDELEYERLFGGYAAGTRGHCSVFNCGPVRLSEGAIERRKAAFEKGGFRGLQHRYFHEDCKMTQEQIDEYLKEWG